MQIFSGQPMQLGQIHYHGLEELLEVSDYDDRGPGGAVISSQTAVIVTHLVGTVPLYKEVLEGESSWRGHAGAPN